MHPKPPVVPNKGESDAVANHGTGAFAPHGVMEVFQQGPVFRGYASGPFNDEFMKAWGQMWVAKLKQRRGQETILMATVFSGSVVASLDAFATFSALMRAAGTLLPADTVHIWQIADEVEGRSLMLPLWKAAMGPSAALLEVYASEAAFQARIEKFVAELPRSTP